MKAKRFDNLIETLEIGIVLVDQDLRVQRYTSVSTEIFDLSQSDIGKSFENITHQLDYDNMLNDLKNVLKKQKSLSKVVCSEKICWYHIRMHPYHSDAENIEGVVLTFVEFTDLKGVQEVSQGQPKQEALANLGVYALEQRELETIMKRAIDVSCVILDLDCSVIFALNKEDDTLKVAAQAGCAEEKEPLAIDKKWDIGYAFKNDEPTIVTSYDKDERFAISPFLEDEGIVSSINIVIRGTEKAYGLLGFYTREKRKFTDQEVHFLQAVANIVGMAIQDKYVKEDLKKEVKRSEQFQREILKNSVAERWELGSYLHDNLAQTLVSVKIAINEINNKLPDTRVDLSDEVAQIEEMIDDGLSGIRDLTEDIIPIDMEDEGVAHAFRQLVKQAERLHGVNCTFKTDETIDEIENRKLATNLYHIIQEAVKNAAIHGKADNIAISLTNSNGDLTLLVKDDGVGLQLSPVDKQGRGLRIMEHRMELMGGTFDIEKLSSGGETDTLVTCTIPLEYLTDGTR